MSIIIHRNHPVHVLWIQNHPLILITEEILPAQQVPLEVRRTTTVTVQAAAGQAVPEATTVTVRAAAGQAVPEATTVAVQATAGQAVPEATTVAVRAAADHQAVEAIRPEAAVAGVLRPPVVAAVVVDVHREVEDKLVCYSQI